MPAADYLLQVDDVPPGVTIPAADAGCDVVPLVDGASYFGALYGLLTALRDNPAPRPLPGGGSQRSFVFLSAWVIDSGLGLPEPRAANPDDTLISLLAGLAKNDVDIWILLWLDPALVPQLWSPPPFTKWLTSAIQWLMSQGGAKKARSADVLFPQYDIVLQNLASAVEFRQYKALQNRVVLDYTADPTGSHHMKVAAIYNAQQNTLNAFCGGMDPYRNRAGVIGHNDPVDGEYTGSPLDLVSYPADSAPAAPTLTVGVGGNIPAGSYDVRYKVLGSRSLPIVSPWSTIDAVPDGSVIEVSGMTSLPEGVPAQKCGVYARRTGTADLPRLAGSTEDPGGTVTLTADPAKWGEAMTLWEWHDTAVQVQGPAALRMVQTLCDRWNDVIGGLPFTIDARAADSDLFSYTLWHGPVNEAPVQVLAAPSVSAVPGAVPAGSYDVCFAVTAQDTAGHTLYLVSDAAPITLPDAQGIEVSNFQQDNPLLATASITTVDVYVSAGPGPGAKPMLAGSTNDPTQPLTILTDAGQWTGDLNAPFQPQQITGISSLQPAPPGTATQTVQMLRTFAHISGLTQQIGAATRPYSFAPKGEFTVYYGYRKAIAQAQQYVYVEDQCMYSSVLMEMLAQQMNKYPDLKILLVTSGLKDPGDPDTDWQDAHYWNTCIHDKLIASAPTPANVKFYYSRGLTVHSKLVIIDDVWAAVGSANAINHSFAVDSEMQMSIYDGTGAFPCQLRTTLWAEHLNIGTGDAAYADLSDIGKALTMWWDPGASTIPQPHLYRVAERTFPVPSRPLTFSGWFSVALPAILGEATTPPADSPWPPI